MLKNFVVIALRNLWRHKTYALINVLGLAIGMAACIFMVLFLRENLGYNQHFENSERIYRLLRRTQSAQGDISYHPGTSGPAGPALERDYPEVETTTQLLARGMWIGQGDQMNMWLACIGDQNTPKIFNLPLIDGDAETRLQTPFSAIISERMARFMFRDQDPIGQVVTLKYKWFNKDYTITGVFKDTPRQTTNRLRFHFLTTTVPPTHVTSIWNDWKPNSSFRPLFTYILLREGIDPQQLENKLPEFFARYMGEEAARTDSYTLQPLERIQLHSNADYSYSFPGYGDINTVYEFTAIAGFILLIACVNFMNLSTARSTNRAREVGLRKVIGAHRTQIMVQFLGESTFLACLALILGLFFAKALLPEVSNLLRQQLEFEIWQDPIFLISLVGLAVIVGIIAGSYPAFMLSSFHPVDTLKGNIISQGGKAWFRKGLVISQFAISIVLIVSTLVVYKQGNYLRNQDVGFRKDNVMMFELFNNNPELHKQSDTIKQTLLAHPNIHNVSQCERSPGLANPDYFGFFRPEGFDNVLKMGFVAVDDGFVNTFDLQMVAGRNFSKDIPADRHNYIINEATAKFLGWENPIGKRLHWPQRPLRNGVVIGVVKNFNDMPLQHQIGPLVLWQPLDNNPGRLALHISPDNIGETIEFLRTQYQKHVKGQPFYFWFVDASLKSAYRDNDKLGNLYSVAALLAIFVTCLGLLGLASFIIQQRTREIGVRKVFGASVSQVLMTISQDFLYLVLFANLIAWPVAYWLMSHWLQTYAYRVSLGLSVFILSGFLSILIASATIGIQALRAARTNPIDTLRYE